MLWMPDCSCYEVKKILECTPLAFLKDKGKGLRFKVSAALTENNGFEEYIQNIYIETYLYFDDAKYYGKNMIDERYEHAGKEYVPVIMDIFPNGDYELICFWVQGERYAVEKTLEIDARGSFNAGGVGVWHKVDARLVNEDDDEDPDPLNSVRRKAGLYFEINKWFISIKTA
jgi:hypothetical protein